MKIKDGDVFNWYWKEDTSDWPNDPYWCMDNQCFALNRNDCLYLVDTYWQGFDSFIIGSSTHVINPEKVVLEFVCNLNETDEIHHYEKDDYDKVYNLSRQKNCYKHYRVDKNAETSKTAIRKKYENKIREAEEKKRRAEWDIQYYSGLIKELDK